MKKMFIFLVLIIVYSHTNEQVAEFDSSYVTHTTGSMFEYVAIGDLNGDGLDDVVGATTQYFDTANDFKIFIWLQDTSGSLQAPIKVDYTGYGIARSFTMHDLNNDGKDE